MFSRIIETRMEKCSVSERHQLLVINNTVNIKGENIIKSIPYIKIIAGVILRRDDLPFFELPNSSRCSSGRKKLLKC
jgi:hypothetical protein